LSCPLWRCELSRPDRPTSAFSVGVCRGRRRHCRCDRRTHSDAECTSRVVGQTQFTPPDTTDSTVLSCLAGGVGIIVKVWGHIRRSYVRDGVFKGRRTGRGWGGGGGANVVHLCRRRCVDLTRCEHVIDATPWPGLVCSGRWRGELASGSTWLNDHE